MEESPDIVFLFIKRVTPRQYLARRELRDRATENMPPKEVSSFGKLEKAV